MAFYTCPSCDHKLVHGVNIKSGGHAEHIVFCINAECHSEAAKRGGRGEDVDLAFKSLGAPTEAPRSTPKATQTDLI
jgi:hypothetical protein